MPMKQTRWGWGSASGGSSSLALGPADFFKANTWNARCWTCYKKCKADEMLKLSVYDGNGWVCRECFEVTNPQQFVRGVPDRPNVPWTQPTPPPLFAGSSGTNATQTKSGILMFGGRMYGGNLLG